MARCKFARLTFVGLVGLMACGDKMDPGLDTEPAANSNQVADPNALAANPNASANPNAAASNANSTGNPNAGTNPNATPSKVGLCGTKATTIGYAAFANASVKTSCTGCHATRSPIMTNYANTKAAMQSQGIASIAQGSMPQGGFGDPNDKCIINAWANGGYQP